MNHYYNVVSFIGNSEALSSIYNKWNEFPNIMTLKSCYLRCLCASHSYLLHMEDKVDYIYKT
jgi:hypothetical protein